jgi:magnesium-transporting ATPase (P-type)
MDSLASLALATEQPKPELLLRMPLKKTDFIVTRKMGKHIIWMSIFQMTVLFIFLFAGEYIIPESNEDLRFNE